MKTSQQQQTPPSTKTTHAIALGISQRSAFGQMSPSVTQQPVGNRHPVSRDSIVRYAALCMPGQNMRCLTQRLTLRHKGEVATASIAHLPALQCLLLSQQLALRAPRVLRGRSPEPRPQRSNCRSNTCRTPTSPAAPVAAAARACRVCGQCAPVPVLLGRACVAAWRLPYDGCVEGVTGCFVVAEGGHQLLAAAVYAPLHLQHRPTGQYNIQTVHRRPPSLI
jgi:hypothetical protein